MTAHPKPKHFTCLEDFEAALIAYRVAQYPAVTNYDPHHIAAAKRKTIAAICECAAEEAWDVWADYVEHCEDLYERGIGPAWD